MNPSLTPTFCGLALVAALSAGLSHWHSTEQLVKLASSDRLILPERKLEPQSGPAESQLVESKPSKPDVATNFLKQEVKAAPASSDSPAKHEFYEALLSRMESLQRQNSDLLDQLGETNRDLMKLEFRIDTHSESFRPLPVSEERWDNTIDSGPGVLPPRAEPISLPSYE